MVFGDVMQLQRAPDKFCDQLHRGESLKSLEHTHLRQLVTPKSHTDFHENLTNGSGADTGSQTDGRPT